MNRVRRNLLSASLYTVLPGLAATQGAPFVPSQSAAALEQFALQRNQLIQSLSSSQVVDIMLDFYASAQPVGLSAEPESDMLLYQWGVYDWGKGQFFEFDMTRQFIRRVQDTSLISQLSLKATYPPSSSLASLELGSRWCKSASEVAVFREFILSSAAYRAVAFIRPKSVAASWSLV
jgi:hypothetical protein